MIFLPLFTAMAVVTPNPRWVEAEVAKWEPLDIEVEVVSKPCGYINAYYFPTDRIVVMCSELYKTPDLARFVLNHELAHAFNHQHGLDWGDDGEFKADELAFLMSDGKAVLAATKWFLDSASAAVEGDTHPAELDRAAMLICLDEGWRDEDRQCATYYRSALATWTLLVNQTERM